MDIEIVIFNL